MYAGANISGKRLATALMALFAVVALLLIICLIWVSVMASGRALGLLEHLG